MVHRTEVVPADIPRLLTALVEAVRQRTHLVPRVGIVLGSGLHALAEDVSSPVTFPLGDLPGLPRATAPGHAGRLVLGTIDGVNVVVLDGRLHAYEGLAPGIVVAPVLLMGALGARTIVLTNAAGGISPALGAGAFMVIADHLNLTGTSPLIGANAETIGPRFVDQTDTWSSSLRARLHAAADAEGVHLEEGVYAGLLGPSYETPAEVRMLRTLGADAVGMSTVLEAIAARWAGLEVCGISLITNKAAGMVAGPISDEHVMEVAGASGPRLAAVVRRFVREMGAAGAA